MLLPQEPHHIHPPLNNRLQATAELLRSAVLVGLRPCHYQKALCQHLMPGLPHSYWPYPRALVDANEAP